MVAWARQYVTVRHMLSFSIILSPTLFLRKLVRYGYHIEVMARSQLHALLLQRVPPKRFVTGKVLGMVQGRDKVTVRCSDGSTHEGDILIAADGAFSNIRHTLYWTLDEKKRLPKTDTINMSVDLHVISGCTKPLDPEKFPVLLDTMSEIQSVQLPEKPYTVRERRSIEKSHIRSTHV